MSAATILSAIETAITAALTAQASGMPVFEYELGDFKTVREAPSVAVKNLTAIRDYWSQAAARETSSVFRPVRLVGVSARGS